MTRVPWKLVGATILCLASCLPTSRARPAVIKLDDTSFEHQTQASTGQTTGIWYVLFTAHGVFVEDWERIGKEYLEIDPSTIFAYVDVVENPILKERFNIKELPHALLFRDRKMYMYRESWGPDDLEENLKDFCSTTYAKGGALEVPPPPGPLDGLKDLLQQNQNLIIGAGAVVLANVLALITVLTSGNKAKKAKTQKRR